MKHHLLFLLFIITAIDPAAAQLPYSSTTVPGEGKDVPQIVTGSELPLNAASTSKRLSGRTHAKMTGAAFYTESFPALPTGWTITTVPGSVNGWRWANRAPTGTGNNFPINGLINSATKGDGWLLYNADSVLNTAGAATRPIGGAITSSAIPVGSSHGSVMLSFQQYYRYSTGDSCFVDVSANGTTWTSFLVQPNMTLTQFGFLYSNPTVTTLDISSVVGGQASAYIRFRFISTAVQFSFNWLIDDLMLYDADPIDLGIAYSGIASASESNEGFTSSHSYSSIPLQFADTVFPVTYLSNYGQSAQAPTMITARYFMGNTLVGTQTTSSGTLPVGARDSVVVFTSGFKPGAIGDYSVALSMGPVGDAVAGNNLDTIRFRVSDSAYITYGSQFTERNCFLNRPSTATTQYWGSRFTISNGVRDTITSVSVAFRPETAPGERIQAQLYQASGSGTTFSWLPLASSGIYTLTAADISTPGNVVITNIPMRAFGGSFASLVLDNGDYAIVLTTVGSTKDVAVYSMEPPLPTAPDFIGYQGQSDISLNDGSFGFAAGGGIATGLVQVPLVHPNFGNARALLDVNEPASITLGAAFPNPAHSRVHIPIALRRSGPAELVLRNAVGQVVDRHELGGMQAGVMQLATISTIHLPEGLYFYTVRVEGGQAAGRVMVRH